MNKAGNVLEALRKHYGKEAFKIAREPPFRALIGCILSQRTRDENASKATDALFAAASTPREILALEPETLRRLIKTSGYYNQKAKYITGACRALVEDFKGETPAIRAELLSLPGVGPKTADIVLSYGYGEPAIAVDTHIHRVSTRVGLAKPEATPGEVKEALEGALSRHYWTYADGALLQLGKDFCKQTKPRCGKCPLRELCDHERSD